MDDLSLGDDTLKQRRNLMVLSVFLIFADLADVGFGHSLNLFGGALQVHNPDVVGPGLVFVLFYFLWRYYQYFKADSALHKIKSDFWDRYGGHVRKTIRRVLKKYGNLGDEMRQVVGDQSYKDLKPEGRFHYSLEYRVRMPYDPASGNVATFAKTVSGIPVYYIYIRKIAFFASYLFDSRVLTDYVVPLVLFSSALVIQVF